jgi:pheromone shutdown protein TraB
MPSASAVSPSASSLVVGFSVDLETSRNLLPAVAAQLAALLMGGDCIGGHRQRIVKLPDVIEEDMRGLTAFAKIPRYTGTLALVVGVGHVILTLLLFPTQLADMVSAGVVASVRFNERAGEQAAAVWFAVNGVLLMIVGLLARVHQETSRLPASPGWLLAVLGALWIFDSRT